MKTNKQRPKLTVELEHNSTLVNGIPMSKASRALSLWRRILLFLGCILLEYSRKPQHILTPAQKYAISQYYRLKFKSMSNNEKDALFKKVTGFTPYRPVLNGHSLSYTSDSCIDCHATTIEELRSPCPFEVLK